MTGDIAILKIDRRHWIDKKIVKNSDRGHCHLMNLTGDTRLYQNFKNSDGPCCHLKKSTGDIGLDQNKKKIISRIATLTLDLN